MTLFFAVLLIWFFVVQSGRAMYHKWRQRHLLEPARYVSEIRSADYFRRLSPIQFHSLVMQVIRARQYTLLGDPYWGRSKDQGYLWKKGKKTILVHRPQSPLTEADVDTIAKNASLARADNCIVFSPFSNAPKVHRAGVDVLAGKKLVKWFSVLDGVTPPVAIRRYARDLRMWSFHENTCQPRGISFAGLLHGSRLPRQEAIPPTLR